MATHLATGTWAAVAECGTEDGDNFILQNRSQQNIYVSFGDVTSTEDALLLGPKDTVIRAGVAGEVKVCCNGQTSGAAFAVFGVSD